MCASGVASSPPSRQQSRSWCVEYRAEFAQTDDMVGNAEMQSAIRARLAKNGLTTTDAPVLRISGSGSKASTCIGSGTISVHRYAQPEFFRVCSGSTAAVV